MNKKLYRVLDEIQKTEKKIVAWQEHLGELNVQKEMLEDAAILKSVRSLRLGSRELLAVLEGVQDGTVIFSEKLDMADGSGSGESAGPGTLPEPAGEMEMTEPGGNPEETTKQQPETAENAAEDFAAEQGLPESVAAEREDF